MAAWKLLLCALLVPAAASGDDHDDHAGHDHDDHDDHGHGAELFEWAGIFKTPDDTYVWTAQKVEGSYADPKMKLAALPAGSSSHSALEALVAEGKHALEQTCTEVEAHGVITPKEDTCYHLHFDENLWQSLFKVNATGLDAIAFFAEHVPTEFESTAHYLKDKAGEDIEPDAEEPHAEEAEEAKPWGMALGGSIIINIVTLVGVIFMLPGVRRLQINYSEQFIGLISGFVAGALLSCAFFLLLFEATHLVGTGWDEDVDILWRWGIVVLAGFMLPTMVDISVASISQKLAQPQLVREAPAQKRDDVEKSEKPVDVEVDPAPTPNSSATSTIDLVATTRARIIGAVLIGDLFHNICDGIFVGAAFKGCGDSFGWGVVLASVLHELPQEIADFALLTGERVNLSPLKALTLNFASGMGVLLGALVILATEVSDAMVGLFLAFGAGVYLHIAAVECMPRLLNSQLCFRDRVACIGAFLLGATLIGLILLDHEHCVPEGGDHHGHAH
eukprot:TRINITY_DN6790_c0_g2_i3.p1 TRINITY_DN6790_c0_g2~~TRINITY_DN6790_c0_g2_i3.p1  ORF type:complete len:528 (-),score=118.80 TRINITY_DN6790_c0_g2_i3:646-2157(-)